MGRKKSPGLYKRGGYWHIDKQAFGSRIRQSTGSDSLEEAEKYLAHCIEEKRQAIIYGVRPKRNFRIAALKYLEENQHKASIKEDESWIRKLDLFIGELNLEAIHMGSLQKFIKARQSDGVKNRTINYGLQVVRRILNLAAGEWLDEHGLTWLAHAPKIKLMAEHDRRKPYPLSWDEQKRLLDELPDYLTQMTLFAVNTGCRDREICQLRWEWEIPVSELPATSVFLIPGNHVKNRDDRLVVLNKVAQSVVNNVRGKHSEFVFTYLGKPLYRMLTPAWKRARIRIGLPHVRVHDLKHTFGRRLRAAGVGFEDRQDLLGHRSGRITTHYSTAELQNLITAANRVCEERNGITLTVLKLVGSNQVPTKLPQLVEAKIN